MNESQQRTALLQSEALRQIEALMQVRAATSVAFGDLQVLLLRQLAARLNAGDADAIAALPVEASTDQLEAAIREAKANLDTVLRQRPTLAAPEE